MNTKICFVTTYIGKNNFNTGKISNNFKKNENYDYLCFTNLNKNNIENNSWEIIEINTDNFKYLKNSVQISRYFKFMIFEYLRKINRKYDFVFYCDTHLYPNPNINWKQICEDSKNHEIGIIQYKHQRHDLGIEKDFEEILRLDKDTNENIEKTKDFLKNINKNIDFKTPQYYENTIIGFNINNKNARLFMTDFWNYYTKCPTFRDQPLWNFMYLHKNIKPYLVNDLKKKFVMGHKPIRKTIDTYNKNNIFN